MSGQDTSPEAHMKTGSVAKLGIGLLVVGAALAARAQGLDKPVLLVASPDTAGFYNHAVLVVMPRGDGHVGFIINRATRVTVASAFPEEPASAKVTEPIYLGGPRAAQSLYAVVRNDPGQGSRLFGELFLAVDGTTVDRVIRESPREARYFAGFAGWEAGELAAEVGRGKWLVAEPEERLIFHPHPEAMWGGLVERIRTERIRATR
jgi:putative transcriptional regulator